MKKVLVMVDWYEPGFKAGGPIRSCVNLVRMLKDKAGVSVITRHTDYHEKKGYENVIADQWTTYNDTRVFYFSEEVLSFSSLKTLLGKESPSILYLNSMFSFYFTILPFIIAVLSLKDTKVVLAPRGMLAPGALSIKSFKKKIFLSLFRMLGAGKCHWHATTEQEKTDILGKFPDALVHVAPNLVIEEDAPLEHISKERRELKLVSIARISPEKNLLYALKVLEEVKHPVQFRIYGTINDHAYWNECREQISKLTQHEISYEGAVKPENIRDVLSSSHFLFMPTLGENFGHIIIESFLAGTPVIISNRTPWRDLKKADAGFDLDLDNSDAFVNVIDELILLDGLSYNVMSKAAHDHGRRYLAEKNDLNSYRFLYS